MAAESFLFNIAQSVLGKLASLALQELSLAWGVKGELGKIEDAISTIKAVLLDAEEQQEKSNQLRLWLDKLKDLFYDADDVVDEFQYEVLRQQVVNRGRSTKEKVRRFFSHSNPVVFRFRMGHKIKGIRERFSEVRSEMSQFQYLNKRDDNRRVGHIIDRETHSYLDTSDVIGRENDKRKIIDDFLLNDHERLSVIPVVGIGGLGKTALAKMLYNDTMVCTHFELRMWVCVSDDFNVKKVIGEMIKVATGTNCDSSNFEYLQRILAATLRAKRFLLILDDVWNEDPSKWDTLISLLREGAHGSKVVVTTRTQLVASIMGTTSTYNLQGLPEEDCLFLLMKSAFGRGQEGQNSNLVEIGRDIVKKCGGVPLAVRTLGSLLYMKAEERDWLFVRDNEIWNLDQRESDILLALKLSYDQLPSYLKQCFAFCSLFPKDYEFNSIELIEHWIAHGFIQPLDQNLDMEEIGHRYFTQLWSRSFFQDVIDRALYYDFKMHDLMHDLALFVMRNECSILKLDTQNISKKVRYICFCSEDLVRKEVPPSVLQLKNLRAIYLATDDVGSAVSKSFVETCFSRFKCLRVLDLASSSLESLPSSIGGLKHLRCLNLRSNGEIKSLPNSLGKLQNLQTLILGGCVKLEKLPRDLGKLINLRHLEITTQERCLLGKGIGSLTSLRFLGIVGCGNIEDMFDDDGIETQRLTSLRTFFIHKCESLVSLRRGLRYLTSLENLLIGHCEKLDLMMDADQVEQEDRTQGGGLKSLRCLALRELPKLVALPRWLFQGAAAHTLKDIQIENCENFTTLPEWLLENLKSLQKLNIKKCPKLESLPEGMNRLTALKEIRIDHCPELTERCKRETGDDWGKRVHVPHIYLDGIKI